MVFPQFTSIISLLAAPRGRAVQGKLKRTTQGSTRTSDPGGGGGGIRPVSAQQGVTAVFSLSTASPAQSEPSHSFTHLK